MEGSSKGDDMDFELFDVISDIEFLNNANDIFLGNYQHNGTAANFSKETGSDDPTGAEASNARKAPVNDLQPETFGFRNAEVDRVVSSPGSNDDSFLQNSNSNRNLGLPEYSGFGGNGSSLGQYDVPSPVFSPLIMEQTHSFPMALAEILPQNEDYSTRPFNSERKINSDQTNQVQELPQNRVFSTQSFNSRHGVNSIQTNQAEKLPQNGDYSTQSFHSKQAENFPRKGGYSTQLFDSEHVLNPLQTNQIDGHVGLAENLLQNGDYSTQLFDSDHGMNSVQANQFNSHIGMAKNSVHNGNYPIQPFNSEHGINSVQTNQVNDHIGHSVHNKTYPIQPFNSEHGINSVQTFNSEHGINSVQTNQVNDHIGHSMHNETYPIQPFNSEHGINSIQTNQVNDHIGHSVHNGSYPIQPFNSEHGINSIQTNQVNDHIGLAEKFSQNTGYSTQPLHSDHGVNLGQKNEDFSTQVPHSIQPSQVNGHVGSSLQAELLGSQRVESFNQGKTMLAGQLQQNNENNNFSDIHQAQALPYPNSLTQINQQAPTWVPNKGNEFYRPLAPAGQQYLQFPATDSSDPHRYNFESPRPAASLRSQQLNNPRQLLNQVPNMPNASNSLLQPISTNQSMPFQQTPRLFSHQRNQVPIAPRAYNPQTYSTSLPESSMRFRTPIRPTLQTNPLGASDLQYLNSLQSRVGMLPSNRSVLEDSNEQRHHQFGSFSPMRNQFGTQSSNSMLQEALMHSSSYKLPAQQQTSNQFPMMPSLPNSDNHNPILTESSFLPRLPQQGLQNQTARPTATFPTSGTSLPSTALNSLLPKETGDTSAPNRTETSLRGGPRERGNSGRRRGQSRRRVEPGGSSTSPFKRFRRDSTLPQPVPAQQENVNSLPQTNEAGTSSTTDKLLGPRPIKNAVYDPIYEGIGLPIDPHLRIFATI